jgi:hypothetical protein
MLPPEARQVAVDLLRPPAGHHLEIAVLTTYTLDLDALLALPLAVLAQSDQGIEQLLSDPLLVLTALREAAGRLHVFVDQGGIGVPTTARPLFALLESTIHPVRAPNGGVFHPKVWVAKFVGDRDQAVLRVAVLSRNLTFDQSWDIAMASETTSSERRRVPESRDLANFIRQLRGFARPELAVPSSVAAALDALAENLDFAKFPVPQADGFADTLGFKAFGLDPGRQRMWKPLKGGTAVLAIAPFVNKTSLESVAACGAERRILVSRQESLDALQRDPTPHWDEIRVLREAAQGEPEDGHVGQAHGLHAKLIVVEHGADATWFVGSANLTSAAFTGANVELMAILSGPKGGPNGKTGVGIARFAQDGFLDRLCEPYQRRSLPVDGPSVEAQRRLDEAQRLLLCADLRIQCTPDGEMWHWGVEGEVVLPAGIRAWLWPIAWGEDDAKAVGATAVWRLPETRLTAFAAFRLSVDHPGIEDVRLTLKLPAIGLPDGRVARVLRSLIDSPERLLCYLRALLGGLDGLVEWSMQRKAPGDTASGAWSFGAGGETLLDDLLRAASRDPTRLEAIRKLFEDLRATEEGSNLIPDDLFDIWQAVQAAVARQEAT